MKLIHNNRFEVIMEIYYSVNLERMSSYTKLGTVGRIY
jgi:hypothetical protein